MIKFIICVSVCLLVLLLTACKPAPPSDVEYMTEYEMSVVSRAIKKRGVQSPASVERTDYGFIVREMESGKVYRIKVDTPR